MRIALFLFASLMSLFSYAEDKVAQATETAPKAEIATPYVTFKTTEGDIVLQLNPEKAPLSVANFLSYVEEGYYKGTVFHRVIKDFMIQGGGFTTEMVKKATKDPIKNEADNGLYNNRGTIAMARTFEVNSATSQFFINVKNNPFLNNGFRDFGYAVFGEVIKGLDVVDAISTVKTSTQNGMQNVPVKPVVVKDVVVSYKKPA